MTLWTILAACVHLSEATAQFQNFSLKNIALEWKSWQNIFSSKEGRESALRT